MIFNGYTPNTLLPVLAAIAVIVLILYLLRVRRRRVSVPYIGLWREVVTKSHRGWQEWVRRLVSFLLCMLVVGLIALALMDPREEEDTTARRHAIFIVDTSASMAAAAAAENEGCDTRLSCALRDAGELIRHMGPTDRAVIIEASGIVSAISGPFQADRSALQRALRGLKPRATAADMSKALELAAHLAEGRENPEIYLFTDGQFADADALSELLPTRAAFEQKTYGTPSGNLSIEAFNVRRYIANRLGFEVFFRAHNGFEMPVKARLRIYDLPESERTFDASRQHDVVAEKILTLSKGESELRIYDNLTLRSGRMAATLEILDPQNLVDPMPMDDIAYARIPDYARPDIACITPGNLYLEAALLMHENYRVQFIRPDSPEIRNAASQIDLAALTAAHDIVILDNSYRNLPPVAAGDWAGRAIFINPEPGIPLASKTVDAPLIERVNSRNPISRWLSLKNLNIAQSHVFSGVSGNDLVMRAIEGPLIASHKTDAQRYMAVGFSLVESDIIFRVALPILFINAIDWLMDENDLPLRAFPTGAAWHVPIPGASGRVDVVLPDGSELAQLPVYDGTASIYGEASGFYRVKNAGPQGRDYEFAANFANAAESRLDRTPAVLAGPTVLRPTLGDEVPDDEQSSLILNLLSRLPESSQYIWVLALLIAMGILSIEWITYHRRWTV